MISPPSDVYARMSDNDASRGACTFDTCEIRFYSVQSFTGRRRYAIDYEFLHTMAGPATDLF